MAKRIHLDNLMRARLKRMVDAAMPEYLSVQDRVRQLEALVAKSIESGGVLSEEYIAEARSALGAKTGG